MTFAIPVGDGRDPLIGLDDIAWFAVHALTSWQSIPSSPSSRARDLAVIGDSLTGEQIAQAFERVTGTPAEYLPVPLEAVRSSMPDFGRDFAAMFEFFQTREVLELDRDLPSLREIHPGLLDFEDWLRATGWNGQEQQVQKFPRSLPTP